MDTLKMVVLLACVWTLGAVSAALAGPMHHHPAAMDGGAPMKSFGQIAPSPFDGKLEGSRIHCELLGHNPLLPCPHHQVPAKDNRTCILSKECAGGPAQAPSSRSVSDAPRFLVLSVSPQAGLPPSVYSTKAEVYYHFLFSRSLDRPPRSL